MWPFCDLSNEVVPNPAFSGRGCLRPEKVAESSRTNIDPLVFRCGAYQCSTPSSWKLRASVAKPPCGGSSSSPRRGTSQMEPATSVAGYVALISPSSGVPTRTCMAGNGSVGSSWEKGLNLPALGWGIRANFCNPRVPGREAVTARTARSTKKEDIFADCGHLCSLQQPRRVFHGASPENRSPFA